MLSDLLGTFLGALLGIPAGLYIERKASAGRRTEDAADLVDALIDGLERNKGMLDRALEIADQGGLPSQRFLLSHFQQTVLARGRRLVPDRNVRDLLVNVFFMLDYLTSELDLLRLSAALGGDIDQPATLKRWSKGARMTQDQIEQVLTYLRQQRKTLKGLD